MSRISIQRFENPNEYISYYLGFIWGDGWIYDNTTSGRKHYRVSSEIVTEDYMSLKDTLDKVCDFYVYHRVRKNRKPQTCFGFSSKEICKHLRDLGYKDKSNSHKKAIENIPEEYRYLWLRGLFDADGCIYFSKTTGKVCRQYYFCSCYEQDWTELSRFLDSIGSKHSITRNIVVKTGHRYSNLRASNLTSIKALYEYLYPNGYDGIGLKRKHNKFVDCLNCPNDISPNLKYA